MNEATNAPTCCWIGTNSHSLSAYQRKYISDSLIARSNGSCRRFTTFGNVCLVILPEIQSSISVKWIFQSFQRTAFSVAASLK